MNPNQFTIKTQEVIQKEQLVQEFEHQQIENEYIFRAILDVDKKVLPFIFKKSSVNQKLFTDILDSTIKKFCKSIW